MPKLLVVEDNPEYQSAVREFLKELTDRPLRQDVVTHFAEDYDSAVSALKAESYDGALIDCFFPKKTESGDISLGREVVQKMAGADSRERRIVEGLKLLEPHVDLNDPDMRKYARFMVGNHYDDLINTVIKMSEYFEKNGKVLVTHFVKNTFKMTYKEDHTKDYYRALLDAIEQSEANQPLGIEVAERVTELGLPLVLVTSTYHHDILTQPVQNYASKRGWRLVDCYPDRENEKATPAFWQRAYDALKQMDANF